MNGFWYPAPFQAPALVKLDDWVRFSAFCQTNYFASQITWVMRGESIETVWNLDVTTLSEYMAQLACCLSFWSYCLDRILLQDNPPNFIKICWNGWNIVKCSISSHICWYMLKPELVLSIVSCWKKPFPATPRRLNYLDVEKPSSFGSKNGWISSFQPTALAKHLEFFLVVSPRSGKRLVKSSKEKVGSQHKWQGNKFGEGEGLELEDMNQHHEVLSCKHQWQSWWEKIAHMYIYIFILTSLIVFICLLF